MMVIMYISSIVRIITYSVAIAYKLAGHLCGEMGNYGDTIDYKKPPDFVYSISLIRGLLVSRDSQLCSTIIVASAAAVEWIGYQVPERD